MKNILVVDIGGTNVKLMISRAEKRKFDSGPRLSPRQLVAGIKAAAADWKYDAIAIGFPAPVKEGRIVKDPKNLSKGWTGWDFRKSLGKPVRVINDAAMQALGSFHGGRMLFLGLGTGLGSAMVWPRTVLQLELSDLPYPGVTKLEDCLGKAALAEMGRKAWMREVEEVVVRMKLAFIADYVVLGGGNAKNFSKAPPGAELGHNRNAYLGGCRLWETDPATRRPKWQIL